MEREGEGEREREGAQLTADDEGNLEGLNRVGPRRGRERDEVKLERTVPFDRW